MEESRKVLLETQHLSVEFNGFQALTDVSIKIYSGELRVIIGPNGAGKTTFMDLVTGKTAPTSGKIFFEGHNITGKALRKSPGTTGSGGNSRAPTCLTT